MRGTKDQVYLTILGLALFVLLAVLALWVRFYVADIYRAHTMANVSRVFIDDKPMQFYGSIATFLLFGITSSLLCVLLNRDADYEGSSKKIKNRAAEITFFCIFSVFLVVLSCYYLIKWEGQYYLW